MLNPKKTSKKGKGNRGKVENQHKDGEEAGRKMEHTMRSCAVEVLMKVGSMGSTPLLICRHIGHVNSPFSRFNKRDCSS